MKKENKQIYLYIGLSITVIFIALTPYIFTKGYSGIIFNTDTGAIGDTIGGITAPFINLLAAFLVWISFREQVKANKLLSTETSYNFIKSLIEDFHKSFTKFSDSNKVLTKEIKRFSINQYPYQELSKGKVIDNPNTITFTEQNNNFDYTKNYIYKLHEKSYYILSEMSGSILILSTVLNNLNNSNLDKSIKTSFLVQMIDEYRFFKKILLKNKEIIKLLTFLNNHHENISLDISKLNKTHKRLTKYTENFLILKNKNHSLD
ncbi:hypothetical protein Q4553_08030 [Tenacibaculum soleae]|uniref:hypothetical protein n=1 Tax=Tenacibaculum soleae TaxID=447689 RepID=UPI0026E3DB7D|nr:hypothetical protein [Tenacibaculum soleae]MDO6744517.1 hypothetical protein [Tenacibaculum soleae]